jgi:hypothetical protein
LLEERAMLSVAQDIQDKIAPYQSAINTALDVATSFPLVGHQFDSLQELSTLLETSLPSIQAQVSDTMPSGHYEIPITLPTISHTFTFDLGLDALLQVSTAGGVAASLTPTLNIAFDYDGNGVSLDTAHTNLDLGFGLSLPNFQATASLNGLLYTHIADASLANQTGTSFNGHLKFGFDANNDVSANFSGDAHVRLNMDVSFLDPALNASFNPTFHTQFQVDWSLDTASNQLQIPHIAFKNFSLDIDSFTHNFLGDIIKTAQKYTKPLQPFIEVFDTPVPILSAFDSSQTVGDLLLQGAGLSADQQDRFELMIRVIKTVNSIDLSGSTGGAVLNFGDINLTGATLDGSGDLLAGFGFDTSQLSGVIDDIMNSPVLNDLKDTLQSVASYAGFTSTAGFQFPVLEDPGPVIGGILTGQARDMFTFTTGREHFELAPSIGVGIKDVVGVFLSAGITFDASFAMGYDTAGLIKLVNDPLHKPEDLLHGFYFDNSVDSTAPPIPNVSAPKKTALYLQGFAELSASAIVTLSGGLYANVNVELATANTSSHVYLDDLIVNLSSPAKIFHLSGQVYAAATIELTLPNPVGPDITLFSYDLAKDVILDFDPPPPPTESKPLVVIDVTDQHTLKLSPSKIGLGGAVMVQPFHDYNVGAYLADGIRVDYAGEIDLYVERKNDVTSTYYNVIGIDGATPDGVSITVIDPFRMFIDEGVNSPAPAQTKPGVIFAGGKNVYYKYVDAADGSHATVLLAGGYGSSTLTGGTMEFGNFIPAERLDQAKQHFGDTSGFDAAGVALVNSTIDADVAPGSPAGIIGSTMTASHGGLMLGGPGSNSFIATGAGAYEMIGGTWVNTFNISPSFASGTATYQIDGGPGTSTLIVRVPAGDLADFENGTVADKYDPAFKALDIYSNAGLFATAHGIDNVQTNSAPGSTVVIGDTSELNIQFKLKGSGTIKFGGSNAPDDFSVSSVYEPRLVPHAGYESLVYPTSFYGTKDRRSALLLRPWPAYVPDVEALGGFEQLFHRLVMYGPVNAQDQLGQWAWVSPKLPQSEWPYLVAVPPGANFDNGAYYFNNVSVDSWYPIAEEINDTGDIFTKLFPAPTYTIGRTFGTNGRTQNITFELGDAGSTQIILDGRGASDNYVVNPGLGSFIDITIDDSDETTQNSLLVNYDHPQALADRVELTDTAIKVEFVTPVEPRTYDNGNGFYYYTSFGSSVSYSPTVNFDANTDITLRTNEQFRETIVNRPNAPQKATLQFVNASGDSGYAFDVQVPNPQLQIFNGSSASSPIDVIANGGNLVIDVTEDTSHVAFDSPTVNVYGNSGTVDVKISKAYFSEGPLVLNVYGNSGTVKLDANQYANRIGTYDINVEGNNGLVLIGSTAKSGNWTFNIDAPATAGEIQTDLSGFTGQLAFNVLANAGSLSISTTTAYGIPFNVLANSGTLSISRSAGWTGNVDDINVLGNSGILNVSYDTAFPTNHLISITHRINVLANTGTINSTDSVTNAYTGLNTSTFSAQINVGTDGAGGGQNLSNVHGTINLLGENGYQSLNIDDRNRVGSSPSWLIASTQTRIGDLTINYDLFGVGFQAFWNTGTAITYRDNLQFWFRNLNGLTAYPNFPFDWNPPSGFEVLDGFDFTLDLLDYFGSQQPPGATTYAATNLPPGLSLNAATGHISGTISLNSYAGSPYHGLLSATNDLYTRQWSTNWVIDSAISIYIPYYDPVVPHPVNLDETIPVSFDPIFVSDNLNRTPVVTVTGLPPGLSFDANTGVISGTVPAGASTHGPYQVHVHADDGIETNDIAFPMIVSGIQLTTASIVRLNHNSDAVNFNLNATTTSGGTLAYSATGLPAGISLNAATGQITGTLAASANTSSPYFVEVSYDDGFSSKSAYITWTVLQTGVTDQISFPTPSPQTNLVGDSVFFSAQASTSLSVPLQFLVQGMPPGLTFSYDPNYLSGIGAAFIYGVVPPAAALNSPYHVTITATDGLDSASVTFTWQITSNNPPPALPGDYGGDHSVDAGDYVLWRKTLNQSASQPYAGADGNGDGVVNQGDFGVWRAHFGQTGGSGAGASLESEAAAANSFELVVASAADESSQLNAAAPLASVKSEKLQPALAPELFQSRARSSLIRSRKPRISTPARPIGADRFAIDLLLSGLSPRVKAAEALDDSVPSKWDEAAGTHGGDVADQVFAECGVSAVGRWHLID